MDMRNFYRRNLPVLLVLGIILALAGAGAAKQAAAPSRAWSMTASCLCSRIRKCARVIR